MYQDPCAQNTENGLVTLGKFLYLLSQQSWFWADKITLICYQLLCSNWFFDMWRV